ncbi:hypothetical protein C3943_16465 [Lysinibacillus sp. B2A1]|nr:hypothetical protein C3943_16465 [Lysinibacillus sp. B2A1]
MYMCCTSVYGQELLDNAINLPSFHEDFKEFCYFGQELLDILFFVIKYIGLFLKFWTKTFRHFIFL